MAHQLIIYRLQDHTTKTMSCVFFINGITIVMAMLAICNSFKRDRNFNDITTAVEESTRSSKRTRRRMLVRNLRLLQNIFPCIYMLVSSKQQVKDFTTKQIMVLPPKSFSVRHTAAIMLQKFYRSYRTRRNLADCAIVCEELWWKASEFADESESAISRWARARTMASKAGIGFLKEDRAQTLALRHWLEAIDPRHRYGHNLNFYYDVWFWSQSSQPFFYWLDVGDGKGVNLDICPRNDLQKQLIKYLGPEEREAYEVIVEGGRLVYRKSKKAVETREGDKWIFVLSSSRVLYVGLKKKGQFQHSTFLSAAATISSGRLVAHHGLLQAIWPYSGHYRPTPKDFMQFIHFLELHNVDLTNVMKYAVDDDVPLCSIPVEEGNVGSSDSATANKSSEWSTGVGPRICCMKKYPISLQVEALEQLNLLPTTLTNHDHHHPATSASSRAPIIFMRPSMKVHLSPGLVDIEMGLPSITLHLGMHKSNK